jgi:hypothetical protein
MTDRKQINFTIVPDDEVGGVERVYEVMPLSEKEIRDAEAEHIVRAPVKGRIVMPVQFIPTLIAALQENLRIFSESHAPQAPAAVAGKGPVH